MEIKSLRYFLAVAREENMTKAADMLHVTQPTLSKALITKPKESGYFPGSYICLDFQYQNDDIIFEGGQSNGRKESKKA